MKSKLGSMNKDESRRADRLKRDMGCVACRQVGYHREADLHHILDGGRRVSHSHSIPLCPWHHRGNPPDGMTEQDTVLRLGPSMAKSKRSFVDMFGTEEDLLHEAEVWLYQNEEQVVGRK